MDSLLGLDIKGLPHCEYAFLNVETSVYLYHENQDLLNTETVDSGYQEIIRRIKENGDTKANTYSYRDKNNVEQLVVYKYLKDRDWVFMVRDSAAEVYGAVTSVRIVIGTLCTIVAAMIILVTVFILYRQGKELMVVESAIRNLGQLNLSADQELEIFNDCIQSIKILMDDIALASVRQSEMITSVEKGIKEISEVVQTNSVVAKESAEVSQKLSEQARTLNGLISQFRIK